MDLKCEIICVGSELLLGDTLNTNVHFLTNALREIGIDVYYHKTVGDNIDRIIGAIEDSFNRGMNFIITSGGLGPTDDDLTKEASAKYFNKKLNLSKECLLIMGEVLGISPDEINDANKKQAYIPDGGTFIKNNVGTAPGVILKDKDKIIINLPGPPKELYEMFNSYVGPYLRGLTKFKYYSEYLRLYGTNEGEINHTLREFFSLKNPTVAPYFGEDGLFLRITSRCEDEATGKKEVKLIKDKIYEKIGDLIYGEGNTPIEERLFDELKKRNLKISFGESLTGGLIASRFINVSGASSLMSEGYVTYSNEAKERILGVKSIKEFGAISKETAKEMAEGLVKKGICDVGVSSTGVAGPDHSEGKNSGKVYIGVCIKGVTEVLELSLIGDRERIRLAASREALSFAYNLLRRG